MPVTTRFRSRGERARFSLRLLHSILLCGLILAVVLCGCSGPRPEDTTAARVYREDAYATDYCAKADLTGAGLQSGEIPKAYTPGCRGEDWPAPILSGCTEPLPPEAADLRGLWVAREGQVGHIERIEQCGNRMVVSNARFIHDFRTTGSLAEGANDVNPRTCRRVRAAISWSDEKTLEFKPWGLLTLVTRRLEDEDTMIWEYPGQPTSTLERICRIPRGESQDRG